jgi:uncharacterized protein YPO0396
MAEELGTRDVLEQMDTRLDNVEQDIRQLRQEIGGLRTEMKTEIRDLRAEMNGRFTWLYGLLVAVLLGVAGLWFK